MSLDLEQSAQPLTSADELTRFFAQAERPRAQHMLGLEHEKFVYPVAEASPVPYEGARGIQALLEGLVAKGLEPFREAPGSPVIALMNGKASISLEPGGQFELSGAPHTTARAAHEENAAHIALVKSVAEPLGLQLVALGYRPFDALERMPWMPKTRYRAMRESLPKRGRLALDMMLMTATGQVSLDWEDEADCVKKVTTVARLSPLLVALYANSPIAQGQASGYLSYRSRVWEEVDPTRCGYLPAFFDGSFSYKAYVDWALAAPLLFLRRGGGYLQPELTFRQLLENGFEGKPAIYSDWVDHLSTLFPEVRIKKVLEVRAADCVNLELTGALPALWRGLLYDAQALTAASELLPKLSFDAHRAFHEEARKNGLKGTLNGKPIAQFAREMVAIAAEGLRRLDPEDSFLLEPLAKVAASGNSPAESVLNAWTVHSSPGALLSDFRL